MDKPDIPLEQKRNLILNKVKAIQTGLTVGNIDQVVANLRFAKVKELFEYYDTAVDELEMRNPEDAEVTHADNVRTAYYALASQLHTLNQSNINNNSSLNTNTSTNNASVANNTTIEAQRLAKLPTTDLPKFDGNFENWLSFKNTFKTLIDGRKDLDDLNKFLYLRGSLTGAASNKLSLYNASAENYTKAWALLTETYQKERALVLRHYDALLGLGSISNPTNENLTKLIDDARQHLNDLESLKAKPTDAFVVRILELKLPMEIRDKWEETFTDDNTLPTFESFSKFIIKTAFRFSTRKPYQLHNTHNSFKRRRTDYTGNAHKAQKNEATTRALVTTTPAACPQCKGSHPLYKCQNFNILPVEQRVKFVKSSRLCQNCLREHKGTCNSIKCRICQKFHHTMLHLKQTSTHQPNNTNIIKANTSNSDSVAIPPATDKGGTA